MKAIRDGDTPAGQRAQKQLSTLLAENVIVAPAGAPEDWTPPNPPKAPYVTYAHDGGSRDVRARGGRPSAKAGPELPRERAGLRLS